MTLGEILVPGVGQFLNARVPLRKKINFFYRNIIIFRPIECQDMLLEIFMSDFLVKNFKKLFLMHFLKMPFCKVGFSVQKFKRGLISLLFIYKIKHHRSNFGMNLTFLCQFWVPIPERSNLSFFDHPLKWPYEVLWTHVIKIVILFRRGRLGLSIIFLLLFWLLVWEESFEQLSHICQKYRFSRSI